MTRTAATLAWIELVVEALTGEPEEDRLFEINGPGIMVAEPKVFGRVYLHDPHEVGARLESLQFVDEQPFELGRNVGRSGRTRAEKSSAGAARSPAKTKSGIACEADGCEDGAEKKEAAVMGRRQ